MSIEVHKAQSGNNKPASILRSYPIDLSKFLQSTLYACDESGVPYHRNTMEYDPTAIAHYALSHWNLFLATQFEHHRQIFLTQAYWLVEHESRITQDAGGWPILLTHPDFNIKRPCLSAHTQGSGISVLVRAYQLTQEEVFLEAAGRAVRTFERDILDGGVAAPVGDQGIFFEEVAIYLASHILNGFIFGLIGLYDYLALTDDGRFESLINCSHATMHSLLDEFDLGFWTCNDLLQRRLATPSQLALQVELLEALSRYAVCLACSNVASNWKSYQYRWRTRLRYHIARCYRVYGGSLWNRLRTFLFPRPQPSSFLRVCITVAGFPVTGGVLTILEKITQVTGGMWQTEYLTKDIGPGAGNYVIHRFGTKKTSCWHFPFAWLYFFAGFWKLVSLMHHGAGYSVIMPQDGTFTGAFVALAARIAGVRVVCIDHGEFNLLTSNNSRLNRAERLWDLENRKLHWLTRFSARQLLAFYWPSRYLSARIAARFVDHYLIPGVSGDGLDEVCKRLGVYPSRTTRFANMIDLDRHILPNAIERADIREKNGIAAEAIVIAIICRLAPEKGLEIALEAISQALSTLSPDQFACVHIVIAGDGPLRRHIEEEICVRGLKQKCLFWGHATPEEVTMLLGLSDIFLYTSLRGAGYPLAILEAMASSCAVIASTEPLANEYMLAEGRGIIVPVGDVVQTSLALIRLLNDPELRRRMGSLARNYVAAHHSPAMFKRTLMRATSWSALDEFLDTDKELETAMKDGRDHL